MNTHNLKGDKTMLTLLQQCLKQQKKNQLLVNELKEYKLLSQATLQRLSNQSLKQKREVIDNYTCLLFLEQQSRDMCIEAVKATVSKCNFVIRLRIQLLLWLALCKTDIKLFITV